MLAIWRFLQLAVGRYEGGLTGETLMVLTIIILDRAGHPPTVSELAKLLDIPKSNISRYIAHQLAVEHLEEVIDPRDRRRRLLQPTAAGRREFDWVMAQIVDVAASFSGDSENLLSQMIAVTRAPE